MNLPNSLTILRIFFIPLLVVVLLTRQPNFSFWGLPMNFAVFGVVILLAAAATDWADGFYARRHEQITTLGILLDPIADKLLISGAFISLVEMQLVPAWMVVIIVGREITVLGLRNIASAEGFTIPASALGKTKMVLQVMAVCAVILGAKHVGVRPLGTILVWLVVMSAVALGCAIFPQILGPSKRSRRNSVAALRAPRTPPPEKRRMPLPCSPPLSSDDRRALLGRARQAITQAVCSQTISGFPLARPPEG